MQIYREKPGEKTMKTEFFVEYDLYDTTALQDAQESSESNSDFGNLALMKEIVDATSYGTLEHNFFVLDGSMEEFPDEPDDLAYFSSGQSGADGRFETEQSMTIQFSENHTSIGLTLHFLDVHPLEIEVIWFDLLNIIKDKKRFYPDSLDYFCKNQVEEYGRIDIIFLKTLPYHNIKLQHIEYGTKIIWNSDTIKSGKIVSDTDPVSDKISTDKLTFDFVDSTDTFNIGNADGLHKTFQKKQKMLPYEIVNGNKILLGTFFLDSNSTTKNVSKMSAIDYKGMLSNTDFKDGKIYDGELAGDIIDAIMESSGFADYTVDDETAATPLYGTLKIQTCQKALREVLFACGSIISTSRRTGIDIHKNTRKITSAIPRIRKFSTTIKTDHYVSDVNVKYKTWTLDSKVSEITKGTYGVGTHTIQFTNPAANLTTNAGTIIKQMPYYVVLQITSDARSEVVISGNKYVGEELAVLSSIEHIKSGEVRSTKTFSGSLLNFESAKKAADSILDYYQLQQIIQTRHLAENEKSGDFVEIENTSKKYGNLVASIESLTTDLTGGFISTAKYRGYYKELNDYYYADTEIYGGEEVGII